MTTVIDVPPPPPAIDVQIADFRKAHEAALMDRGHPEHRVRAGQLTQFYEQKFAENGSAEQPAPQSDPGVAPDLVGGDQPADSMDADRLVQPAQQPSDYDFSRIEAPFGVEAEENPELERYAREWMHQGGLSPAEGKALASVYAETLSFSADELTRMGQQTERDLRHKYGADAPAVGTAVMRVAEELTGLSDFLNNTGLFNHPRVVSNLIDAAKRKGYL